MVKRILITLVGLALLIGILGGVKGLQIQRMIAQGEQFAPPPETVTTAEVRSETWESVITAVGSLEAVQGVTVSAEVAGKVVRIAFEPGQAVQAGDLLIEQDSSVEKAELRAAESDAALSRKNLERARELLRQQVIPQATFDERQSAYEQAAAQVDLIRATIAKKTIRAPFAGRLGLRRVDLGEVLESGQPIVSLQALDPIYVNFQLPQQEVGRLRTGLRVRVAIEALGDLDIDGVVTAVNPEVDSRSRNITVQATVKNPEERLRPGMFTTVELVLPVEKQVLTIPTTAVSYSPYSDSVFLVEAGDGQAQGEGGSKVLRQQFIQLGEQRGDFVVVRQGLEAGQTVVSTGVFKLRNGQSVTVDNELAPDFQKSPTPAES